MSNQIETRLRLGATQINVHRVNGESAWMDAVDARRTAQRLPDEWSLTPFTAEQQAAALQDTPREDRAKLVPSETAGPFNV
ncbi:hypothetical protein [Neorhizobium sp. T25_13]|uniref:hypothetical protein n=1 Tax=Neorhizobium sp. T25_13 TaxID=2093830 RepID=UPI000CF97D95|nr:hypothetical protein [Neorhizobium sp. T25_13]